MPFDLEKVPEKGIDMARASKAGGWVTGKNASCARNENAFRACVRPGSKLNSGISSATIRQLALQLVQ